jgi:hypothetical protein
MEKKKRGKKKFRNDEARTNVRQGRDGACEQFLLSTFLFAAGCAERRQKELKRTKRRKVS